MSAMRQMVKDCTVPEQHPATQGHFPGRPIVPGAYLVALVEEHLRADEPGLRLVSLRKVKFLKSLAPGLKAHLEYQLAGDSVKFVVRAGEDTILEGSASIATR